MTEPTTPDDTMARLRLAREVFSPSAVQRERVWTGLAARVPASAPAARAAGAAARATPGAARVVALLKGGALVGMGFVLGYWFAETRAPLPAPPNAAATASPLAGASAPPLAAPVVEPAPAPAASAPDSAPSAPAELTRAARAVAGPAASAARTTRETDAETSTTAPRAVKRAHTSSDAPSSTSAAELALLARAERAIRAGDGALAKSFINDLEARFPKTAWREEREAIIVLAACALGEPGAEREARIFLERHAGSVYFDRIGTLCRLDANGTTRLGH